MAEDGEHKADNLQETAPNPDKPTNSEKPAADAGPAPTSEAGDVKSVEKRAVRARAAIEVEAGGRFQALIRSAFAARAIGASEELSGDLSKVEGAGSGVALRGAYLSRLAETGGSAAAGGDAAGNNVLRAAFVAHADAEALAERPRRAAPAKRRAAAPKRRAKAAAKSARAAAAKVAPKKKASGKSPAKPAKKPAIKKKAKAAGKAKRGTSARPAPSAGKAAARRAPTGKTAARGAPKRRAGATRAAPSRAKQAKGRRR